MWYPDKSAFRVGAVFGVDWDKDSIGLFSFASGLNTRAKGFYSTAMGINSIAAQNYTTALGIGSLASGTYSMVFGMDLAATADHAIAMGYQTIASGQYASSFGSYTRASGYYSTAMGDHTSAKSGYETVLGTFNTDYVPQTTTDWYTTDRLLTIGNGNSIVSRSDAMVVLKNGNIGIGMSTPTNKLHISLGYSGVAPFSVLTPLVIENNDHTYVNILAPESKESGFLFGKPSSFASGGIIYNSTPNLNGFQFRTNNNNTRMVIGSNGNVGIGTLTPNAPLGFPAALGKKITLYPGASGDVGMAVQGNLLQIYSDNPNADIAFGYDQSGMMTERMRITGAGNVGIGMYPSYPLDINGRIRLSGNNPFDPGIWLMDAGAERAFIGLENNNYVGFYGNQGAGWKFVMNNSSGALKVNGSEGQATQVLTSSGSGAAPNWSSVSTWLFNNTYQINQSSPITISTGGGLFPGMDYTNFSVVIPSTSKLILSLDVKIESIGCFSCGGSYVSYQTNINRDGGPYDLVAGFGSIPNSTIATLTTGIKIFTVPPGTYTFYSYAYNNSGPAVKADKAKLLVVVIPQ